MVPFKNIKEEVVSKQLYSISFTVVTVAVCGVHMDGCDGCHFSSGPMHRWPVLHGSFVGCGEVYSKRLTLVSMFIFNLQLKHPMVSTRFL